jgi:hypothetical protein
MLTVCTYNEADPKAQMSSIGADSYRLGHYSREEPAIWSKSTREPVAKKQHSADPEVGTGLGVLQ